MAKDSALPVLTHVLGYLTGILAPLIILLVSKEEYVKRHARLALNWQISIMIYYLLFFVMIMPGFPVILIFIAVLLFVALSIVNLIFVVMAAIRAGEGKLWSYPLAIPFLRNKNQ